MAKPTEQDVLSFLRERPGLKASQMVYILKCKRSEVNSVLYSLLSKKLVEKDDKFCWFLKSDSVAATQVETETKQVKTETNKNALIESLPDYNLVLESFRGNSLFHFEHSENTLQIKLNTNHQFFQRIPSSQLEETMNYLEPLLVSAAMSLEKHYYEADLIEEIIDDWGTILMSKL